MLIVEHVFDLVIQVALLQDHLLPVSTNLENQFIVLLDEVIDVESQLLPVPLGALVHASHSRVLRLIVVEQRCNHVQQPILIKLHLALPVQLEAVVPLQILRQDAIELARRNLVDKVRIVFAIRCIRIRHQLHVSFAQFLSCLIQKVLRENVFQGFHLVDVVMIALNHILKTKIQLLIQLFFLSHDTSPQVPAQAALAVHFLLLRIPLHFEFA